MKLMRNLMLSVVAAVALLTPLASQPAAQAHSPQHHKHGHHRVYYVYYRTCVDSPWVCYGGYYQESQAVQAVTYYRSKGYDAFYR